MNISSKFRRHSSFIIYNPVVMFQNHYCNYFFLLYIIKALIFRLAQKVTVTETPEEIIARILGGCLRWSGILVIIGLELTRLRWRQHSGHWLTCMWSWTPHSELMTWCSECHPLEYRGQPWRGLQRWRWRGPGTERQPGAPETRENSAWKWHSRVWPQAERGQITWPLTVCHSMSERISLNSK